MCKLFLVLKVGVDVPFFKAFHPHVSTVKLYFKFPLKMLVLAYFHDPWALQRAPEAGLCRFLWYSEYRISPNLTSGKN